MIELNSLSTCSKQSLSNWLLFAQKSSKSGRWDKFSIRTSELLAISNVFSLSYFNSINSFFLIKCPTQSLHCSLNLQSFQWHCGSCTALPNYATLLNLQSLSIDYFEYLKNAGSLNRSSSNKRICKSSHQYSQAVCFTCNFVILFLPNHSCVRLTRLSKFWMTLIRLAPNSRLVTLTNVSKCSIFDILLLTK